MEFSYTNHHRRSIRIKGYDYSSPVGYFVTVVTQDWLGLFGEILNAEMICNPAGNMIQNIWLSLPERYPNIKVDCFQIMPNHFHGIIIINDVGAGLVPAPFRATTSLKKREGPAGVAPTVGENVCSFKLINFPMRSACGQVLPAGWHAGSRN